MVIFPQVSACVSLLLIRFSLDCGTTVVVVWSFLNFLTFKIFSFFIVVLFYVDSDSKSVIFRIVLRVDENTLLKQILNDFF